MSAERPGIISEIGGFSLTNLLIFHKIKVDGFLRKELTICVH